MERKIKITAEIAVLVSLAFVLKTFLILFTMPNGGSINLGLAPLIILSFRRGIVPGFIGGFIISIIHIFTSFYAPPVANVNNLLTCILCDYIIPYSCVGLSSITRKFKIDDKMKIIIGVSLVFLIEMISYCFSGFTIWKDTVPENQYIVNYVIFYNLVYCFPNYVVNLILCLALKKFCFCRENLEDK